MTAPTLAEVEALALRARAGDPLALEEYPDAAKALLDHNLSRGDFATREEAMRGEAYTALWERIVELNEQILLQEIAKRLGEAAGEASC